jgi:hypothetical protein
VRIGWLLGWAVPAAWFEPLARAAFPAADHVFRPPAPGALAELESEGPFDWVAGYSLGTLLLLGDPARAPRTQRVALLAPIFAFPLEAGLGGTVSRSRLRQLARWLQREPAAALADFYQRAGLDIAATAPTPAVANALAWGLQRLDQDGVAPPMPAGWRGWCGAADPLLDAARLNAVDPAVAIVAGATHHPAALLRAFAAEAGR